MADPLVHFHGGPSDGAAIPLPESCHELWAPSSLLPLPLGVTPGHPYDRYCYVHVELPWGDPPGKRHFVLAELRPLLGTIGNQVVVSKLERGYLSESVKMLEAGLKIDDWQVIAHHREVHQPAMLKGDWMVRVEAFVLPKVPR
jgi:hypothetical protein